MRLPTTVINLLHAIANAGGRAWMVGGCVRDHLLDKSAQDLDIEVHELHNDDLLTLLNNHGRVKAVGKSFGVYKLRMRKHTLDISIPQVMRQAAEGGKIHGDPFIGQQNAARRRDLTINAIYYCPLTQTYLDPFGGRRDLSERTLRAVDSETFAEDPLRVLRVMQFAARFEFEVAPSLVKLCRVLPLADLPPERVWIEFKKLLTKPTHPSIGLKTARLLDVFPRLIPDLDDDPSIDVRLDRAASARHQVGPHPRSLALVLAAMLSRCTPEQVTAILDRFRVHNISGYPLRDRVLHAIKDAPKLLHIVTDSQLKWMAEEGEIVLVAYLAWAISGNKVPLHNLERAHGLGVGFRPLPTLVGGADLIELGVGKGPLMGELLRHVRRAQLDGEINHKDEAIALLQTQFNDQLK